MLKSTTMLLAAVVLATSASATFAAGYRKTNTDPMQSHAQVLQGKSAAYADRAQNGAQEMAVKPFTVDEQRMFDRASAVLF
jgi:hypothetical protein